MSSGYLDRRAKRELVIMEATRQTYCQFMMDMLVLTLNDPAVMGNGVFEYKRIRRILDALGEKYDAYAPAVTKSTEADYFRSKIDEAIKRICGAEFVPFEKRYEWLSEITYKK